MKSSIIGLMHVLAATLFAADVPTFDVSSSKFEVNKPPIIWAAGTNQLPAALWVYKVVPQKFPVKAINKLLSIGEFTNRITFSQGLSVSNSSNTCTLVVVPSQGRIRYWNLYASANHWDRTNHLWEKAEDVPNQAYLEKLGLKFLNQFGIKPDNLAKKNDGTLFTFGEKHTRSYYDMRTKRYIDDEVIARGIFFLRRIDNVNFTGIGLLGGCYIEFGNHKNISDFKLLWRNLKPYKRYKLKTPDEIKHCILDGETVLTRQSFISPKEIKAITITKIEPFYTGADESERQEYCSPFAELDATVNTGQTNVGIGLYCSVLSTNIVP